MYWVAFPDDERMPSNSADLPSIVTVANLQAASDTGMPHMFCTENYDMKQCKGDIRFYADPK